MRAAPGGGRHDPLEAPATSSYLDKGRRSYLYKTRCPFIPTGSGATTQTRSIRAIRTIFFIIWSYDHIFCIVWWSLCKNYFFNRIIITVMTLYVRKMEFVDTSQYILTDNFQNNSRIMVERAFLTQFGECRRDNMKFVKQEYVLYNLIGWTFYRHKLPSVLESWKVMKSICMCDYRASAQRALVCIWTREVRDHAFSN